VKIFESQEVKVKTDKGVTLINLASTARICGLTKNKNGVIYIRWTDKGIAEKLKIISSTNVESKYKTEIQYILDEIENADDRNLIYMSSWLSKRLAMECHSEKANDYKTFLATLDEARENSEIISSNSVDPQTVLQLAQGVQLIGTVVQSMQSSMIQIQEYVKDSINSKDLQIEKTMDLIGLRAVNTKRLTDKLKEKLFQIYGFNVTGNDPLYANAKKKVFKHFKVIKWEDIPVTKYNAVDAFIDGLEKDELAS
jgi:hypothetical protein